MTEDDLRVVTVNLHKTLTVKVCGDCIDACGDDCKGQDRTWGECGCPHCYECDCDECSTYIGSDQHNAKRHAIEQTGIDRVCPACERGDVIPRTCR